MKQEQDDLSQRGEFSLERLPPPEIVGEVSNQLLESMRRLWWRVFARVSGFFALIWLSIRDWFFGPER